MIVSNNNKCMECNHQGLCKYEEAMIAVQETTPIIINDYDCNAFEPCNILPDDEDYSNEDSEEFEGIQQSPYGLSVPINQEGSKYDTEERQEYFTKFIIENGLQGIVLKALTLRLMGKGDTSTKVKNAVRHTCSQGNKVHLICMNTVVSKTLIMSVTNNIDDLMARVKGCDLQTYAGFPVKIDESLEDDAIILLVEEGQ